jgi:hypothetical protein
MHEWANWGGVENAGEGGHSVCTGHTPPAQRSCTSSHPNVRTRTHARTLRTPDVQAAARQLGGARLCAEGHEGGAVTHLVVGAERRTLKVLLAIANGAHMVRAGAGADGEGAGGRRWEGL